MPVRSLTQSVLRWPRPEAVLAAASRWAEQQRQRCPSLQLVGVYGSYGRGEAGVGSDLDLLQWPLAELPLSCDALVLSPSEYSELLASGSRMALELQRDLRWL
jgi:hypothetical protein